MKHRRNRLLWAACLLWSAQAWAQNVYSVAFSVAQVGDKRLLHVSNVSVEADDATRDSVLASYAEQLRRAMPQRAALFQDAQARLFPSQEAAQQFRQRVLDNGKAGGMDIEAPAAPSGTVATGGGTAGSTGAAVSAGAVSPVAWPLTAAQAKQRQADAAEATGLPLTMKAADMEFILIPAGEFVMGSPPDEPGRGSDEAAHRVRISKPFYIARDDREVSARTLAELDKWLNQLQSRAPAGYAFRLPTEAEWEYAARAGRDTAFHTGSALYGAQFGETEFKGRWVYRNCFNSELTSTTPNDESPAQYLLDGGKLYASNGPVGPRGCDEGDPRRYNKLIERRSPPAPGRQFQPNAWGLYDVAGRLGELVADRYASYASTPEVQVDPLARTGEARVLRGGNGIEPAPMLRLARRAKLTGEVLDPNPKFVTAGVRLVLMKLD